MSAMNDRILTQPPKRFSFLPMLPPGATQRLGAKGIRKLVKQIRATTCREEEVMICAPKTVAQARALSEKHWHTAEVVEDAKTGERHERIMRLEILANFIAPGDILGFVDVDGRWMEVVLTPTGYAKVHSRHPAE